MIGIVPAVSVCARSSLFTPYRPFMLKPALFALLAVLASLSASADTFTFSYAFNGAFGANATVIGSLTGTQTGDTSTGLVTDIQILSLQALGGPIAPGPIYTAAIDPITKAYSN